MLLLCCGTSGSGKSYFIQNTLPRGLFYNLKSATTRKMRLGESNGNPYYFVDESFFDSTPMATYLFVNEKYWVPGGSKWLYGIPEWEIQQHIGKNMTYDVIEPKYARQLIEWFRTNGLTREYMFRVAWFLGPENAFDIVKQRANMQNDVAVRRENTCAATDFMRAGLDVDYMLSPRCGLMNARLMRHIANLQNAR